MALLRLILLVLAFCCFLLNGMNIAAPRGNLLGYGLACWVLAELLLMK